VTHFGTRAFAVAGLKAWKQLPVLEHGRQLAQDGTKTKDTFPLR